MVLRRTQGYSRVVNAPDGAAAGTAVVGASVGERAGVSVGAGVNGGVGASVGGGVGERAGVSVGAGVIGGVGAGVNGVGAGVGERVTAQTHVSSEMDRTMKGRCEHTRTNALSGGTP